jgi:D-xylonolactonase
MSHMIESLSPECLADYACETGENPLWHAAEKRLYWCDIPNGRIFRYDPAHGTHEECYRGRPVGGFTIQYDGSLLLFRDRGTIAIWKDGELTDLVPEIEGERNTRFNDVIADPVGRVFCGTMSTSERRGRLYRLDVNGSLRAILDGIGCSNGMAFSPDRKRFYYTDSFAHSIYSFDYCVEDGTLSNQAVFATFADADGLPDGATMDADGCLWSALWDGGCIVRLTPAGGIDARIVFPVPKTSSLTFGGEGYADIYVTTAGGNAKPQEGDLAGALFRVRTGVRGTPEFLSRVA